MLDNGFTPDVPAAVQAEVAHASDQASSSDAARAQDLRQLPWSSIDNDSSLDLDQLEVAESLENGDVRVRVAIADVDATVAQGSATDQFAAANSTSVEPRGLIFKITSYAAPWPRAAGLAGPYCGNWIVQSPFAMVVDDVTPLGTIARLLVARV